MLAAPVAEVSLQHLKEQELRRSLREIRVAIDDYKRAYDQGRILNSAGGSGYPASLQVLVDGVEDPGESEADEDFLPAPNSQGSVGAHGHRSQ